jgi:predicted ArsR family transcriptional regulator
MDTSTYSAPVRHEWRLLAELRKAAPNISAEDCAKALGRTSNTIRRWDRDAEYVRYENHVLGDAVRQAIPPSLGPDKSLKQVFEQHSMEMAERLYDIIQDTNDVRFQAKLASQWLDRAGYAPKSQAAAQPGIMISEKAFLALIDRAHEVGMAIPLARETAVIESHAQPDSENFPPG